MSFLRKNIFNFLLIIACGIWLYTHFVTFAPCNRPIKYSIRTFDEKFGISRSEYLDYINEAIAIWEDSTIGKDLFKYDPKGDLKINLIYDSRQKMSDERKVLESKIDNTLQSVEFVKMNLESSKLQYESAKSEYESLISEYNQMKSDYDSKVIFWNQKGGAPRGEYEKLNNEKNNLLEFANSLESKRNAISKMADDINSTVDKHNTLVRNVNSNVSVINRNAGQEFEEGEYISDSKGQRINIYEFTDTKNLIRVLSHEFGHALGLDHNDNPDSIMYYLNKSKSSVLTSDDLIALRTVCKI